MSTKKEDETPANITTDAESQEFGAQHGQTIEGQNTGSSDPEAGDEDPAETGEGTGARAGAYS